MDVTFQMPNGNSFTMDVGIFDIVLDMKQMIQNSTGTPVSQLVLHFEGNLLLDDNQTLLSCSIGPGSHVLVSILPPPPVTAQLNIKLPISNRLTVLVMNLSNSVLQLKQRLNKTFGPALPTHILELSLNGSIELMDDSKSLSEYGVSEGAVIDVSFKSGVNMANYPSTLRNYISSPASMYMPPQPPSRSSTYMDIPQVPPSLLLAYMNRPPQLVSSSPASTHKPPLPPSISPSSSMPPLPSSLPQPPSSSSASKNNPVQPQSSLSSSNTLMIQVLTRCNKRLCLEVYPTDKVQVLKDKLEKLQQTAKFELSPDGYFFIHKQRVMYEKETFLWHNVRQNDEIAIFNGSITYG